VEATVENNTLHSVVNHVLIKLTQYIRWV